MMVMCELRRAFKAARVRRPVSLIRRREVLLLDCLFALHWIEMYPQTAFHDHGDSRTVWQRMLRLRSTCPIDWIEAAGTPAWY